MTIKEQMAQSLLERTKNEALQAEIHALSAKILHVKGATRLVPETKPQLIVRWTDDYKERVSLHTLTSYDGKNVAYNDQFNIPIELIPSLIKALGEFV